MIKKLLSSLTAKAHDERRAELYRNLIRREAKIGGEVFGPVPEGHRREFFCLDRHTWIWHEEWIDAQGKPQVRTTRYDVRPQGILKAQDGATSYQRVTPKEAVHLYRAAQVYRKKVVSQLYSFAT